MDYNSQKPPEYADAIKDNSVPPMGSQAQAGQYWDPRADATQYYSGPYAYSNPVMQGSNQQLHGYEQNRNQNEMGVELGDIDVKPDGMLFDDKSIRAGFIRKVFGILTIQLLFVIGLIGLFVFHDGTRLFVQSHSWLYFVSYIVFLVTYMSLVCVRSVRRKFPGNVIALSFLTGALGYMAAMISSYHKTKIVFMALGICAACCFTVIVFACQTKYDFTKCTGVLFVITMVMVFFGFASIFVAIYSGSNIMYLVYAGIMALVFMVWLAIDVQMVIGGGKKYEISPEDYVMAATELFLDIIYIFIFILQLLGGSKSTMDAEVGGRATARPETSSPPAKLAIKASHLRKRRLNRGMI